MNKGTSDNARRIAYPSGMEIILFVANILTGFVLVSLHLTMRDVSRALSAPTPMPIDW